MIEIVDFDKKFSQDIYEMETSQWGIWENEAVIEKVGENEIVLVALCNGKFAGLISGKLKDDEFYILIACVKPKFQKMGIGTSLLNEIMKRANQKFSFSKFTANAISVYGKCNAKKLLENANFVCTKIEEKYWGKLYPNVMCTECFKKPCECDSLFYELKK